MSNKLQLPHRPQKLFTGRLEFNFLNKMGSGAFSTVYEAVHKPTGYRYAIKVVDLEKIDQLDQENIEKELLVHFILNHNRMIKLYDYFMEDNIVYYVLEFCKRGNLFKYLKRHSRKGCGTVIQTNM